MDILVSIVVFVAFIMVANFVARKRKSSRAEETRTVASLQGFNHEGDVNPFQGLTVHRPEPAGGVKAGVLKFGIAPVAPQMLIEMAAGRGTVNNVLRGHTTAGEAIVFDYRPSAANTSQDQGALFSTVAAFAVPGVMEFQAMPQPRFSIGLKDIEFPSHPRFSKRFMLLANDEAAIRRQFTGAVLEAFERLADGREWQVQAGSGWLLATYGTTQAGDLPELVQQTARVAAALQAGARR